MPFHYFTLEEIYQYAEKLGYSTRNGVEIYDLSETEEDGTITPYFRVSFGPEYTETWEWYFEDLSQPAVDYEHGVWED